MDPRSQNLNIAHPTSCPSPHPSLLATQTLHPTSHVSPLTDQNSHLTHQASDDPPFASFLASQASRLTPDTSNLHITPYTSHLTPHSALFTPHTSPPPPHLTAHLAHLTVVNFPVLGIFHPLDRCLPDQHHALLTTPVQPALSSVLATCRAHARTVHHDVCLSVFFLLHNRLQAEC